MLRGDELELPLQCRHAVAYGFDGTDTRKLGQVSYTYIVWSKPSISNSGLSRGLPGFGLFTVALALCRLLLDLVLPPSSRACSGTIVCPVRRVSAYVSCSCKYAFAGPVDHYFEWRGSFLVVLDDV